MQKLSRILFEKRCKMAKCVYCNDLVPKGRAMEICDRCGVGIWGQKMFLEIVSKTNEEMGKGNLDLGSVGAGK